MLWLVDKDISNGVCVHATNPTGAFKFEAKPWKAAASMSLISLLQIGHLGEHSIEQLVKELSEVPMHNTHTQDGFFNCRVWLRQALIDLVKNGVIQCNDIPQLEEEAVHEANKVKEAVEQGTHPAAVNVSKLSH